MLSHWLTANSPELTGNYFTTSFSCQGNFPDLKDAKVVVFSRGDQFSSLVRERIASLHNHFEVKIVDIGLLTSQNASSNYQVISELHDGHILPVVLDVDMDTYKEYCKAMHLEGKLTNTAYVSNTILNAAEDYAIENIGFQRHNIPRHQWLMVNDTDTPGLSLGALRASQKVLEPILRETNFLHFDLAAIRRSEMSGKKGALPTGLYAEEACQIMRYAGEGLRIKLVTIDTSGLDQKSDNEAMLVATMLWYLHEGVELRSQDHPAYSSDFKEYIVELNEVDHSLTFAQSNKSGKWWLKIDNEDNRYVSCAYDEYLQSIQNEMPDRLLKML